MSNCFNVYLIIKSSDWNIAKRGIEYIKENINPKKVFVVSSNDIQKDVLAEKCEFCSENEIFSGLGFLEVKEFLKKNGWNESNTGWYLQQFVKFAISYICEDEYYLVWDADTIPVSPISFFDKNNRPFFNLKREYFKVYYNTIYNLFGYKKKTKESFISEHMLFNTKILRSMLDEIASDKRFGYDVFWKNLLIASDLNYKDSLKNDQRYFSEFETYGTYIDYRYPKLYSKRKLRTLRPGADFLSKNPSKEILEWAARDFDTISFESWTNPVEESIKLVNDENYRQSHSFARTLKTIRKNRKINHYKVLFKRDQKEIVEYTKFMGVLNFDFFFGKSVAFKRFQNPFYVVLRYFYFLIFMRKDNEN